MIKILFICHGNICRSPMAEFVMKDLVNKSGLSEMFYIASCATSTEEIGNPVHPGTQKVLRKVGISTAGKVAVQLRAQDYQDYDYLVAMDQNNIRNMQRIIGTDSQKKVSRLMDHTKNSGDIADPWYTDNFDLTYSEVLEGCGALLDEIIRVRELI